MNHRPSSSASSPQGGGPSRPQPWSRRALGDGNTVIIAILAVLTAIFAATQSDALSPSVLTDILNNALPVALAAAGGTLVVLTRGFDLSVAGVVSLSNVLLATTLGADRSAPLLALAIVVAVGIAVGATNGVLVAHVGVQSVAATLG